METKIQIHHWTVYTLWLDSTKQKPCSMLNGFLRQTLDSLFTDNALDIASKLVSGYFVFLISDMGQWVRFISHHSGRPCGVDIFSGITDLIMSCGLSLIMLRPGGCHNIKMPSYQHRDSHVKDKTVSTTVLSLTWESPYLGKRVYILRRGPEYACGSKSSP